VINGGLAASPSTPLAKPAFRETQRRPPAAGRCVFRNHQQINGERAAGGSEMKHLRFVHRPSPGAGVRCAFPQLPTLTGPTAPGPAWGGSPGSPCAPRRDPPAASPGLSLGFSPSPLRCMIFALEDHPGRCLQPACCWQAFPDVCRCCWLSAQGLQAKATPGAGAGAGAAQPPGPARWVLGPGSRRARAQPAAGTGEPEESAAAGSRLGGV